MKVRWIMQQLLHNILKKFEDITSIIANGTGNYHKVADEIKESHSEKEIIFYNQNDIAGEHFVDKVVEEAGLQEYNTIDYKDGEEKCDINDLVKDGVDLEEREIVNDTDKEDNEHIRDDENTTNSDDTKEKEEYENER